MAPPSKPASRQESPAEGTPAVRPWYFRQAVVYDPPPFDPFGRDHLCNVQGNLADQCDLNRIVKRYAQTGVWDHLSPRQPTYGDFTGARSLDEAYELVRQAEEEFYSLPADVREKAANDPVRFLEMLASEDGAEILRQAGLPIGDSPAAGASGPEGEPGGALPPSGDLPSASPGEAEASRAE